MSASSSPDSCAHCTAPMTDFCQLCGTNLCPEHFAAGCCDYVPALSGTRHANALYQCFGSNPPSYARNLEIDPRRQNERNAST